jgi:AraC family transcriptional regulator of adaptative response / DNA-3-methyladenine glycosylase II
VRAATTLAGRLVAQFGAKLPDDCLSPAPEGPCRRTSSRQTYGHADVASIGLPPRGAIRALAPRWRTARASARRRSRAARAAVASGVGPWTAEYVAMRALREPDAFPVTDLGLRRALDVSAAELARRAERWRPWRGYAAILLWQHGAA